ncbi:MAG: MFS transporter [Dehalococcoidia bacterium]|nr:MFS transporter [Dehalococcoidia bacterium]
MARALDSTDADPSAPEDGLQDEPPPAPRHPTRLPVADETVAATARVDSGGISTFRSLRHRNYRLLWIGTLFSSSGLWLQQVTINHLAFALSGSSFVVGLANGARSVPLLALGPVGGVMADRYDKKRLMLSTQVAQMVTTFIFAIIIIGGWVQIWHLVVFGLVSGVAWALNMPVRQSVVPTVVPREDMMNAMALNSAGFNITRIVGPAAAGIMIATVGAGENFLIQSVAYLCVAITVAQLALPASRSVARATGSVRANLGEGARYVWGHATLRTQMTLAFVPVVIALPYISILPQFNEVNMGGDATTFGLMMAAPGIGAVAATLVLASMANLERKGVLLMAAIFCLGLTLIGLALSPNLWVALPVLVLVGATQMAYMTTNQTILQLSIPDEYRGRVMGIWMLNQGLLPLGSLFSGTMADVFDAPTALIVMGSLVSVMAVIFFFRASTIRDIAAA